MYCMTKMTLLGARGNAALAEKAESLEEDMRPVVEVMLNQVRSGYIYVPEGLFYTVSLEKENILW